MKDYKTYFFDIDGTLLDTMELIYQTFVNTCRVYRGMEVDRDDILSKIGIPLATQMEMVLGPLSKEELDEILKFHMTYQGEIYPEYLQIFPAVRDTLKTLSDQGKTLGVVTSRTRPSLVSYLKHFDLFKYFSVIATPECTAEHKPSPEPVLWALKESGSSPGETLFIGDAYVDINSGSSAGVDTAFAQWGPNRLEDLPVQPTWVLDSLSRLITAPVSV
ncbi:MAG: HAD-IA family hydrolase [Spirochaetales bacterium]|nr:HAD-IA family hydrolase [Spirochaetales bacterium]